jgi:heme exporter protein A
MQLVVDNVSLERGGRPIIESLSTKVSDGEALVLTGPNGAGKTTLLRAVAGFVKPAEGAIRLEGGGGDLEIAEQCHFVGHRDGVKSALTVAENARFWARYLGGVPHPDVPHALELVGLGGLEGVPSMWLSAGQRRRLGLARLLLAHRPLWLLDEPSVSLDVSGVAMLARLIGGHRAAGGIVLAATHVALGLEGARELRLGGAEP